MTGLIQIGRFLRRHGMSESAFGQAAVNDRGIIGRWRRGQDVRDETKQKMAAYMASVDEGAMA